MAMHLEDEVDITHDRGVDGDQGSILLGSTPSEPYVVITNHSGVRSMLMSIIGEDGSIQSYILGAIMIILILLSGFAFFPEASRGVQVPDIVDGIDAIATVIFMIEFALRIAAAPSIRSYMFSFAVWINFISFVPLPLEILAKEKSEGVNLERWVRLLHVLRLVRFCKLFQYDYIYRRLVPYKYILESTEYKKLTKHKDLLHHIWAETYEQIKAVIPISLYAVLFQFVVLGIVINRLWVVFGGQVCVIIGLFLFLEGLKLSIMPMGEWVSMMLPRYIRLGFVMLAAFVLGIIVTYAEPAVAVLAVLGEHVPLERAPYLYFLLEEWTQPLTLFVGIGVGLAAAVGVLRVRYAWTLRKVIFISMIPCLIITFVCVWAIPDLEVVVGLAWDCGAVTTGPVTVPVVLALGSGVAQSMGSHKNLASATFGIVTLASLFPIVTVQLLAIMAYMFVPISSIRQSKGGESADSVLAKFEETPLRETVNGIRAIAPAVIFFFLLGRFVLRQKVNQLILDSVNPARDGTSIGVESAVELEELASPKKLSEELRFSGEVGTDFDILEEIPDDFEEEGPHATKRGKEKKQIRIFYVGVAAALVGMILFNYGITYGLAELGEQVGSTLPGTFSKVEGVVGSPQYSPSFGIFLISVFALVLGYLCTQAEPGLIVFGEKVEQLKIMPRRTLVVAVAAGVAIGMGLGVIKIVYNYKLIYFILITYGIALVMTFFSEEQIVCIAWDSAGVTTGEITVSFILVLGVSLSAATLGSTEGFGILTMASVGPIISVLIAGFIVRYQKYRMGGE